MYIRQCLIQSFSRPCERYLNFLQSTMAEFKSKGNKDQFDHSQEVLETLSETASQLDLGRYEKGKEILSEGIPLVEKRLKVIKLADRSEFGWSTVKEYMFDELASDSDDEKRIFRSERRAERSAKKFSKRKKPPYRPTKYQTQVDTAGHSSVPQNRGYNLQARIGLCYKLSLFRALFENFMVSFLT